MACVRHTDVRHQIKIIKEGSGLNKQLSLSLSGKVAVVTGPTRGIGLAIAKEFAENNDADVVICSGSKQRAVQLAKEISGKAFGAKFGITDIFVLEEIIGVRHRIDILVDNARCHFNSKTCSKIRSERDDQACTWSQYHHSLLRNIAKDGTYNSMSTDKKMNAIEEPSMKRLAKPGEVSKIVARVASSGFSFATGNTLVVGGGIVLL